MRIILIAVGLAVLAGYASSPGSLTGPPATGDERGGKLAYNGNIGEANAAIRAHCEPFGKKGMITQMNLSPQEGGTIVFQCR
jgi:hypothetical protein